MKSTKFGTQLSFSLGEDLIKSLKIEADKTQQTTSSLIRQLIIEALNIRNNK